MAPQQFICANWKPDSTNCKYSGIYTCKNCYLVLYCGADCQKAHWPLHKVDCKSDLRSKNWVPDWILENRKPDFVGKGVGQRFGAKGKYPWGNVPALDVLQLDSNEGNDYEQTLRLLFAASGDLRNIVKTIAQIPGSYNQLIEITLNDRDIDIVARNVILLLIALVVDDTNEAIDCMIHVWYSALIRKSDLEIFQQKIRPLIQDICDKTKGKAPNTQLAKTWKFGQRSLRLVLEKSSWDSLLSFMMVPEGLTIELATQVRTDVTLAKSRKDYHHRFLLLQTDSERVATSHFRKDGLLLPFGSPRDDFQVPNPTFFQTPDIWPMHDSADPLDGWLHEDVEKTSSGPATADIYGKLFYHLRAVIGAFLRRLSSLEVTFRLFHMNAADLPRYLDADSLDRIEVSNIVDRAYLGIHRTLAELVPLLKKPAKNPHATLISLFMNVVDQTMTDKERATNMKDKEAQGRLLKYLPLPGPLKSQWDPQAIRLVYAKDTVVTHDHLFDRFLKDNQVTELSRLVGAAIKEKHTIIEQWPYRLKLQPGQAGAQEEFDRALRGGVSGKERYVEWKRVEN